MITTLGYAFTSKFSQNNQRGIMLKSINNFQETLDVISHLVIRSEQISKCKYFTFGGINNFEIREI